MTNVPGHAGRERSRHARDDHRGALAPEATGQDVQFSDPITGGSTGRVQTVTGPGGELTATLDASGGDLTYRVERASEPVIADSALGLELADGTSFGEDVTGSATDDVDRTWEPPWGRYSEIRERYSELAVSYEDGVSVTIEVRVFETGVGLRYTISGDIEFAITDERTAFTIAEDGRALWYNDDPNKYEQPIRQSSISGVGRANTPLTMVTDSGTAVAIHESDLTDYATMRLAPEGDTTVRANLVAWPDGETKSGGRRRTSHPGGRSRSATASATCGRCTGICSADCYW